MPNIGLWCISSVFKYALITSISSKRRFEQDYLRANRPVLIRGAIDAWPACKRWCRAEGEHVVPDLDHLRACIPADVEVHDADAILGHEVITE